jgi:hypothetical protein
MKLKDITNIRLRSQHITETKFKTAKEIVSWMGAMQAQDFNMAKWAIGIRLPGSTEKIIETAFNYGEILRTHLLRPTWHFVSSDDINWMLDLTASHIKASLKSRWKELELTENIFNKSNTIFKKALKDGNYLTRQELVSKLENAKISTEGQKAAHLLLRAELDGVICSGVLKAKKQTYALLKERVPKSKIVKREEALEKLARKYFSSHGPAALKDFVWWSGLPVADARHSLEMIKRDFIPEKVDLETYWFANSFPSSGSFRKSVYLLPAYDEYIISYKNRSAAITFENHRKAISNNGIFRPTIVLNGQVAGIWKQLIRNKKIIIKTEFFNSFIKTNRLSIRKSLEAFGFFLNMKTEIQ